MKKTFTRHALLAVMMLLLRIQAEAQCNAVSYSTAANNCGFDYISNVTFAGINRNSTCDTYTQYATPNPNLTIGQTYTISVTTGGDVEGVRAWIDYNIDGIFGNTPATELILGPSFAGTNPATYTAAVTIPVSAIPGATRLRVRCNYNGAPVDATSAQTWGETEDYCVTIVAGSNCSGTPNAGTAAISSPTGCPGNAFNLNASGLSIGAGITFQWESSPNLGGPYSSIPGATLSSFNTSTTTTTFYRLVTNCSFSALSNTSSVVSYSVVNPGPCLCNNYGQSIPQYTGDEEILLVRFGTLNNPSTCTTTAPGPGSINQRYSNYAGFLAAPDVCRGATVPYTVTIGTCNGWYGVSSAIYIDYNQNGVFTDPGELAFSNTTYSATANTYTGNITIPVTASLGTTRMRVITLEGSGAVPPSVGTPFNWGETEDYCINILGLPSISATGGSVCPGQPFVISPSGASTYTYVSPTGTVGTGATATVTPISNTTYTIAGTGTNGCVASGANGGTVFVASLQSPTLITNATPTAYCTGGSSSLTVSGANTYTWNTASNSTMIVVNPTVTTIYTVSGTGTNVCNGVRTITVVVNPIPTIAVSPASPTVCSLTQINFTASGASTYTWNGSSNGSTIALTPTTNTTYTVSGTTAQGCTSTTTIAVVTNSLPVIVTSPPTATACAFSGVTFSASGAVTYTWSNNVNTATNTVYQSANTNYTVQGSTADGCRSSATVGVTTFSLPVIVLSSTVSTACPGTTQSVSVSGANTYTWSNATTGSVSVFTVTAPSQFTVIGTDAQGCSASAIGIMLTHPEPTITITPPSATVCSTSSVNLSASGANSYTWSTGSNNASVTVNPSSSTVYTVSGTDPVNGCVGSRTVAVTANSLPAITVAQNATSVCNGSEATFTLSGASSYNWSNGHQGSVYSFSPSAASNFTVTSTSSLGCVSNSVVSVGVFQLPVITVLPSQTLNICQGEVATFTASGANSYVWTPGAVSGPEFTVAPTFVLSNYTVVGTDQNACKGELKVTVRLNSCVGISEQAGSAANTQIYPNPSSGEFTIDFDVDGEKTLQVYNSVGKLILEKDLQGRSEKLYMQEYDKGVYFIMLRIGTETSRYKLVLQ